MFNTIQPIQTTWDGEEKEFSVDAYCCSIREKHLMTFRLTRLQGYAAVISTLSGLNSS